MMWEAMLNEFGRHKLRTFLTMLGVMIGIFLVTSVSSFSEGIMYYVNDQVSIAAGLIIVREADIPGFATRQGEMDEDYADELRSVDGVDDIAPVLFAKVDGVSITGSGPDTDDIIRGANIEIEEGREFSEGADEIVLGYSYAQTNDYVIGDTVKLGGREFEIVGILQEAGDQDIDDSFQMPIDVLQELAGKEGKVSLLMIKPLSPADAERIEQTINDEYDDISAQSDKSIMNSVNDMLIQLNAMTFALGSIAALISGIVIMNVMIISVRERRREIGTMKAIGATNRQILLSVLLEAVTISVSGAAIGIALSFGGAAFLNMILLRPIALVTPRLMVQSLLFATFIGVASGILPARHAAKLNPIEAIRYE